MDSVVTTPIKVTCDCEGTGNNFVKQSLDNISERLLTPETLLVDAADSNGVETAKNELELGAETEGTLSSLSAIVNNGTRLFPYLKPPLERRAWEWNPITHIDSLSRTAELPIFLDRLFYMPALWFNTSDWFFFFLEC